jgi:hypothetical protein
MLMRLLLQATPGTSYTQSLRKLAACCLGKKNLTMQAHYLVGRNIRIASRVLSFCAKLPPVENTRDKHQTIQSVASALRTRPQAYIEPGGDWRMKRIDTLALRRPCSEAYHDTQIIQEQCF